MEYTEYVGVIIGGVIGFVSAFLLSIFNNWRSDKRLECSNRKSDERLERQLKQSERNLRTQLFHTERKKLLLRFYDLVDSGSLHDFEEILSGLEGEVLSSEYTKFANELFGYQHKWVEDNDRYNQPPLPSEEEWEHYEMMEQAHYESLTPEQKFEEDLKQKEYQLREQLKNITRRALRGEL